MPTPARNKALLCPEKDYHIVFKSIDGLTLFHDHADYNVFKRNLRKHLFPVAELYSYCMIPNHVHAVLHTHCVNNMLQKIILLPENLQTATMDLLLNNESNETVVTRLIERQINSLMVAFSMYTNDKYDRTGGLFQKPAKRILITDEIHLQQAIIYCHANAQKHRMTDDFKDYPYTSYHEILARNNDLAASDSVLRFFGGKSKFIKAHQTQADYYYDYSDASF